MSGLMSKAERADLTTFIRRREKAAKAAAAQRGAELKADVESKLCAIYTPDDDAVMRQLHAEAEAKISECNSALKQRCAELGIPETLAPSISRSYWVGRGENAIKERREELRRAAYARIDSLEKAARTRIENESVELEGRVLANGLTSDTARQFLAAMPTVEQLMPAIAAAEIKELVGHRHDPPKVHLWH